MPPLDVVNTYGYAELRIGPATQINYGVGGGTFDPYGNLNSGDPTFMWVEVELPAVAPEDDTGIFVALGPGAPAPAGATGGGLLRAA